MLDDFALLLVDDHPLFRDDLVLLDYRLLGMDGLHCTEVLMQHHPGVGVGLDDPALAVRAVPG